MMFKSLHKSRTFTIIKSLATSPVGICIYNIVLVLVIISIVYGIFYGLYIFNLYLIDQGILTFSRPLDRVDFAFLDFFELLLLAFIILLVVTICYGIIEISRCIYNTKQKLDEDLKRYECDSVSWQK